MTVRESRNDLSKNLPDVNYRSFFSSALGQLHDERRYRVFADSNASRRFPHAVWHAPEGPRTS